MERYSHIRALPNSPLTPLTPLHENTEFNFNFGGDGSLDVYIHNVRQSQLIELHQKRLHDQAKKSFVRQTHQPEVHRYSERFLLIRDKFESNRDENKPIQLKEPPKKQCVCPKNICTQGKENLSIVTPKTTRITRTAASPLQSTPVQKHPQLNQRNQNLMPIMVKPHRQVMQLNKRQYLQVSPVAAKDLSPRMSKILKQTGLECYCGIFQREEIDSFAYQYLNLCDLQQIGITDRNHCDIILGARKFIQ